MSPASNGAGHPPELVAWRHTLQAHVQQHILPWWATHMPDPAGGWHGGIDGHGQRCDHLPRSAVLGARCLWTFAEAVRLWPQQARWQGLAEHGMAWLCGPLWDRDNDGVYWSVDRHGRALDRTKHSYAQAFAIYALAAWHRSSGSAEALRRAITLFRRLDEQARDSAHGGYREACAPDWRPLHDARLADPEHTEAWHTSNTHIHLLEAFSGLLVVWPDATLRARLHELCELLLGPMWSPRLEGIATVYGTGWRVLDERPSRSHDIETAWLLVRAAQVLGDAALAARARAMAGRLADSVWRHGLAADGSVLADAAPAGRRDWWAQAEGMVGFWDAWQHQGEPRFARAAQACWAFIERHHIDPAGGDWIKELGPDLQPLPGTLKAGPWHCPYHHARACFEMLERLPAAQPSVTPP